MMHLANRMTAIIPAALFFAASPALAAPLTFDCDVPANSSSSVSNLAQTIPAVSGTITAKKFRQGQTPATVGAQIQAPDGKSFSGFVLMPNAADTTIMDIMLVSNFAGKRENFAAGSISVTEPIAFRLFVDDQGAINIFLGDQSWSAPFMRLIGGEEKAFCGSGQFEFSDLRFSD